MHNTQHLYHPNLLPGPAFLKRALITAAAGGHDLLIFGPDGYAKKQTALWVKRFLSFLKSGNSIEIIFIRNRQVTALPYPSRDQMVVISDSCPCGNLGKPDAHCDCSFNTVRRYWGKLGKILTDRMDIRIPLEPFSPDILIDDTPDHYKQYSRVIQKAAERQMNRYQDESFLLNGAIPFEQLEEFCVLSENLQVYLKNLVLNFYLSSRACNSVLKVARTLADLKGLNRIGQEDLEEAVQYRRFGEGDYFWIS